MMNILEKEDLIKGLPDNVLQQQMQNPTGELPQYLLISEIQRRTDMRKSLQEQPKQETVSDQIMMEGIMANRPPMQPQMPQQMLPQMPPMPPQMPQMPMGMAQGGVVRMANGGEVERIRQVINDLIAQGAPQDRIDDLIQQLRLYGERNIAGRDQEIAGEYANIGRDLYGVQDEPVVSIGNSEQDFSKEILTRALESRDMDAARMQSVLDESAQSDEVTNMNVSEIPEGDVRPAFRSPMMNILGRDFKNPVFGDYDSNTVLGELLTAYRDPSTTNEQGDLLYQQMQNVLKDTYKNIEDPERIEADQRIRRAVMAERLGRGVEGIGSLLVPEGGINVDPKFEDMLSGKMSKMDYARYAGSEMAKPILGIGSMISDYASKFLSEAEIGSPAYYDRSYQTGIIANDPRFQERVDLYNRLKEEYGSDVAAAQAIRSAGGQAIDMAGDVGENVAEAASEIKEASTPFFRQLFTGTQEVTPDAETGSGAGIGDIIRDFVMPGYKTNAEKNVSTDLETEAKKVANQKQNQGQKDESVVAGTTGAVSKNAGDQSNPDNVPAPDDVVDPRITDDDGLTTYTTGSLGDYENRLKGILDEERRGGAEAMVAAGLAISEGKNIGQALGAASQAASQARDTQVERQLKAFSALSKNRQQNALLNLKKKVEEGTATRAEQRFFQYMLSSGIVSPDLAMQLEEYARNLLPQAQSGKEKMSIVGTRPG